MWGGKLSNEGQVDCEFTYDNNERDENRFISQTTLGW